MNFHLMQKLAGLTLTVFLTFLGNGVVQASSEINVKDHAYWNFVADSSKPKERPPGRNRERVIKDPLLIWPEPPKSKDQPKKDPPAKPKA